MPAFLLSVVAFLAAVGPHYFLRLGFLEGAYGAQITLDCEWAYHPEAWLGLALLLVAAASLKTRRALWGGLGVALLLLVQAWRLEPLSGYVGDENRILILAERVALRAHEGIRIYLLAWPIMACCFSANVSRGMAPVGQTWPQALQA